MDGCTFFTSATLSTNRIAQIKFRTLPIIIAAERHETMAPRIRLGIDSEIAKTNKVMASGSNPTPKTVNH